MGFFADGAVGLSAAKLIKGNHRRRGSNTTSDALEPLTAGNAGTEVGETCWNTLTPRSGMGDAFEAVSIGFDPPRPRDKAKMNEMLLALLFILSGVYIWGLPCEVLQALLSSMNFTSPSITSGQRMKASGSSGNNHVSFHLECSLDLMGTHSPLEFGNYIFHRNLCDSVA